MLGTQFSKLWSYRWQIWMDITKEMTSDSRETAGRLLWVVVMPLIPLGVYLFLAQLRVLPAHDDIGGVVYVVVGATLWLLFSALFLAPLSAIRSKGKAARRSRYPLAATVASAVGQAWIEFFIRACLCGVILAFQQPPSLRGLFLLLPALIPLSMLFLGAGMIVGVFAVAWKDVGKLAPIVVQYTFFVSNVLFKIPEGIVPSWLTWSNPFAFAIDTARWLLLFGELPSAALYAGWSLAGVAVFLKGLHFLGAAEPKLAAHL